MAAGVDRTFIGRLERAEKGVSLETVAKLAKALGTTVSGITDGIR